MKKTIQTLLAEPTRPYVRLTGGARDYRDSSVTAVTRSRPEPGRVSSVRRRLGRGDGAGAGEQDAVHDAALALVVVPREVPHLPVVPERDRSRRPGEPGHELRAPREVEQVAQQRQRLPPRPPLEPARELRVYVQHAPAR